MRKLIKVLAVVLALAIVSPTLTIAFNPSKVLRSVTSLDVLDASGVYRRICTVSSINKDARYWLTAAHCVDHGEQTYILDEAVTIIELDTKYDLAILQTSLVSLPALKLAGKAPKMGDEIMMIGFQGLLMMNGPTMTRGWVMHPSLVVTLDPGWDHEFMMLQILGAPGNSGSAVVNKKDQVISVLQWGFGRSFGSFESGATYENVAKYKKYFG